MLLDHIGWSEAARSIERAYRQTIRQRIVTADLATEGATVVGTSDMATTIIGNLEKRA
jgi:isocitrate dehydrogenase